MTVKQLQIEVTERAERYSSISDGELLAILKGARDAIIEAVLDLCVAAVEAENRQLDIEDILLALPKYYRRIASGNVSANAWLRFGEHPLLMDKIATLPFDKQEALASGERVPMVVRPETGIAYDPRTHVLMNPLDITPNQIRYVFAEGRIRDVREQAAWADTLAAREPKESKYKLVIELDEELDEKLSQMASNSGVSKRDFVRKLIKKAR